MCCRDLNDWNFSLGADELSFLYAEPNFSPLTEYFTIVEFYQYQMPSFSQQRTFITQSVSYLMADGDREDREVQ